MLDPEPLPSGALALLLSLLEHRPILARNIFSLGLVPVLFQIITVSLKQSIWTHGERDQNSGETDRNNGERDHNNAFCMCVDIKCDRCHTLHSDRIY